MTWKSSRKCYFCAFYIHKSIPESYSTHVRAEDMRINLKTKRGILRTQQMLEYGRIAKDILELVMVSLTNPTGNNISYDLIIL